MLRLRQITTENFGPFKGRQMLDLDAADGVFIVYGENMRGKTSLLNAIRYALFGRVISRGERKVALHQIGNWEAAKEGAYGFKVILSFDHDGQQYTLTRLCRLRDGVEQPASEFDYAEECFLQRGSVVLGPEEAQAILSRLMPEQVSRFFLFDGELLQQYEELLRDESDMGRRIKEAIERILGVPILTNGRTDLAELHMEAQRQESKAAQKDQKTRELGIHHARLLDEKANHEKEIARLTNDLAALRSRKSAEEDALKRTERVKALLEERDELTARVQDYDKRLAEREDRLRELMADAWRWLLRSSVEAEGARIQGEIDAIRRSDARRITAADLVENARKALATGTCVTCQQPLGTTAQTHLTKLMEEWTAMASRVAADEGKLGSLLAQAEVLRRLADNDRTDVAREVLEAIARPTEGLMALATADDPGGSLIRWLLLPMVLLLLILGRLHLAGERYGLFDAELGAAVLMLVSIVLLSALIYYTGHKVSRAADIERQRQLLAVTLASIGDGVIVTDARGHVTLLNGEAERLTGWTALQAIGQPLASVFNIINEETRQPVESPVEKVFRLGTVVGLANHTILIARDGRETPIDDSGAPVRSADGTAHGVVLVFRDFTERKATEEQLRLQAAALESAANGMAITDATGTIMWVNRAFSVLTGYSREEVVGKNPRILKSGQQDDAFYRTLWQTIRGGEAWHGELVNRRKDGRLYTEEMTITPLQNGKGAIIHFIAVKQDISVRKSQQEALAAARVSAERAKATAEEANRAKDHFLAVLSHELRTPLTPVVTALAMLQSRPDFDEPTREGLEMIRRNVEMEARLIDDLLDVTRISRGKVELERKPIPLGQVIHRAVEVCMPDIETRRLKFGIDADDDPYIVDGDATRLQQVFWNLLRNAVKFTPQGGRVGIRCRRDGHTVRVEVRDSGEGIEPEALSRIFNAFEQAERSITRQFGGLGLGLTISKGLVEMHGGAISAHSKGKGTGATFTVQLPLVHGTAAAEPATPSEPVASGQRPLRILLVEDHGDTAKMMRLLLMADGHEVECAGDVATALDLAGKGRFDLLISDLGLPDASGLDLMRELRHRGFTFPGVALSGYGREEDIYRIDRPQLAFYYEGGMNMRILDEQGVSHIIPSLGIYGCVIRWVPNSLLN